jgi:hypothetical protein
MPRNQQRQGAVMAQGWFVETMVLRHESPVEVAA